MTKITICIEFSHEEYEDLIDLWSMYPEHESLDQLVKHIVKHNLDNLRRLRKWIKKIVDEVVQQ